MKSKKSIWFFLSDADRSSFTLCFHTPGRKRVRMCATWLILWLRWAATAPCETSTSAKRLTACVIPTVTQMCSSACVCVLKKEMQVILVLFKQLRCARELQNCLLCSLQAPQHSYIHSWNFNVNTYLWVCIFAVLSVRWHLPQLQFLFCRNDQIIAH